MAELLPAAYGSSELNCWFALLACVAVAFPIKLPLSQLMSSSFTPSDFLPDSIGGAVIECGAWLLAGVKP